MPHLDRSATHDTSRSRPRSPRPAATPSRLRSLRRRSALLAGAWAVVTSTVLLAAVAVAVASVDSRFADESAGRGQGLLGKPPAGGPLRQLIDDAIGNVRHAYTERALVTAVVAVAAMTAASAAAGWWYSGIVARAVTARQPSRRR